MAAMMDTDEDAELALLGSEEDDEQTLRRFLDALPRDATKRDANVAAFLGETCPPAKLLLRAALWAVDGPRCARDALRAVASTKSGATPSSARRSLDGSRRRQRASSRSSNGRNSKPSRTLRFAASQGGARSSAPLSPTRSTGCGSRATIFSAVSRPLAAGWLRINTKADKEAVP